MTFTAEQFLGNLRTAPLMQGERFDSEVLAEWNRAQTHCAICGDPCKPENSHTVKKGRGGAAASQVYALPLCHSCHVEYETTEIGIYLQNHPNLFEIVTRNIERAFDHFIGSNTPVTRKSKPASKPKSDFMQRCAALSDEQLMEAGIRLPITMKRIRSGVIGAAEKRKLKEYFTRL